MRTCGITATQGWGCPRFWVSVASFSPVALLQAQPEGARGRLIAERIDARARSDHPKTWGETSPSQPAGERGQRGLEQGFLVKLGQLANSGPACDFQV